MKNKNTMFFPSIFPLDPSWGNEVREPSVYVSVLYTGVGVTTALLFGCHHRPPPCFTTAPLSKSSQISASPPPPGRGAGVAPPPLTAPVQKVLVDEVLQFTA